MLQLNQELNYTYKILEEIGSGGGGTVYKAWHKRLNKDVVLKKIHSNLLEGNIRAEADILKNLKHPYLPRVFDFLELDGAVYTVMDYIPGKSLSEILREHRCFSQKQVLKWLDQLCQAVELLHSQATPIIHGDIKPANIMLTPEDDICLIDFNVSGDFKDGNVTGYTPGYAAPEQIQGAVARKSFNEAAFSKAPQVKRGLRTVENDVTEIVDDSDDRIEVTDETEISDATDILVATQIPDIPVIDARSDIYSIGATAYHLLTGKRPGTDKIQPIDEFRIEIEDSFAFLIMKCLEKDPKNRYQSVKELRKAVLNVHKSGKQYKKLIHRQMGIRALLFAGLIGSIVLAGIGRNRVQQEKFSLYEEYVALEREAREEGNYEQVESYYQQAVALYPDGAEAVLEKSRALYEQEKYEDTIEFIAKSSLNVVCEGTTLGDIFLLYGNSYFELKEYAKAASAFEKSIRYNSSNPQIYRDHAIALARLGSVEEAKAQLEHAIQYQLDTDEIYYTKGEIAYALSQWQEAEESFKLCIGETDDAYMMMRSYMMCYDIMNRIGAGEGNLEAQKELLEEAREKLPQEYQNAILEELAQVYIHLGNADAQYDIKAIDVFKEIIDCGWGTYTTYNNMAILYQKNQMYEEEAGVLQNMLTQYGENYNTYKRMAFMEVAVQSQKKNEERSYVDFKKYYEKSMTLYEERMSNNQTDPEMNTLKELYQQAVDGGWIK